MRIDAVELDERNIPHVTRRGISLGEVVRVFASKPTVRRNKAHRTASCYAIANGVRVNFVYRPGIARPISAWRIDV